ncbi:MAG: hypothetical protein J7L58_03840, partial [Thermoplasmata archaeon]|nr:hypothetical protein [Thermoplasmata archaeon]
MSRIKFVKEKINGKKGMLIGLIVAAAIILSGISLFMPAKGNGGTPPVVEVIGYVYYQNATKVANAFVNITDVTNGHYGTNFTNQNGYYQIFFNAPNTSSVDLGDKLVVFANDSSGLKGSNDTIVSESEYNANGGYIWLNITLGTPVTNKTLVGMQCQNGLYITLNTTFYLNATDPNGDNVKAVYYRIWHNGWNPSPGAGEGKGNNFTKVDGNHTSFTLWSLGYTEEGTYYIEFYSEDDNTTMPGIEYTHNQTHIVDETLPTSSYSYGDPKVPVGQPNLEYIIGPNTPFWINATDDGGGVAKIQYAVWRNMTHPGDWQLLYNRTEYYNNSNGQNRSVSLPLYFDEGCYYEVTWRVTDCVGHISKDYTAEFAVDVNPPSISWEIGKPNYTDEHGNKWINCSTPIWINITDNGCGGIQAGANRTIIKIFWNETQGSYFDHNKTIVVYDGDPNNDSNPNYGEISYKLIIKNQSFHEVRIWAYDNVENYAADKKQFFVDCKPPWINKTIPKIVITQQTEHNTASYALGQYASEFDNQSFIAEWSYIDAVSLYVSGYFESAYAAWVEI